MRKQQTSSYVNFGTTIRYLLDCTPSYRVHGDGRVIVTMERMFRFLNSHELPVTLRLAKNLRLQDLLERLKGMDEDARLGASASNQLKKSMRKVRDTAIAETGGMYAYVVSEKRLDAEKLADDPGALFAKGIYDDLSEMAQYDFGEACKCIAFERPTAAAFHMMRAVEEALRCFYLATVKRDRVRPLLWHAMTDHLARRKKPPPDELLAQLDHIRRNFRNPTQHPDATYDIDGAQDLAYMSIDVLTRLVRAGQDR